MDLDQSIRTPLQAFIHLTPHPFECRGNPYSPEVRQMAIQNRLNGHDTSATIVKLQQQYLYPHPRSVTRLVNQ